eukprot:gene16222-biopygen7581
MVWTDGAPPWTDGAPTWTERRLDGRSVDLDGADLDGASIGRTERRLGRSRFGRSVHWTDGATVWTELIWTERPSDVLADLDGAGFGWLRPF